MVSYRLAPRRRSIFSGMSVNLILIAVNVIAFLVFFGLLLSGIGGDNLFNYVAIKPANILQGQYLWTFLTSMFMHAGFFHLFANMLTLLFIGSFVERLIGPKRYFWFYIFSGLFAGLAFVLLALVFTSDYNTFAVGASGAIFALVGFLMVITPNLPVYVMFIPIPIKMKYAAPGLLVVLWLISVAGNIPIGNVAHFGGLVAGLVYGFYIRRKYKRKAAYISRQFS